MFKLFFAQRGVFIIPFFLLLFPSIVFAADGCSVNNICRYYYIHIGNNLGSNYAYDYTFDNCGIQNIGMSMPAPSSYLIDIYYYDWDGSSWTSGAHMLGISSYSSNITRDNVLSFASATNTTLDTWPVATWPTNPPSCDPCEVKDRDPVSDCGGIEFVIWDNVDSCDYHCDSCQSEYDSFSQSCGIYPVIQVSGPPLCDMKCDCSDVTTTADSLCIFGWQWDDGVSCLYHCDDCNDVYLHCEGTCALSGGIGKESCQSDSDDVVISSSCVCADDLTAITPPDDTDHNPITNPAYDPVVSDPQVPSADPVDPGDPWLEAIKTNLDSSIVALNDINSRLAVSKSDSDIQILQNDSRLGVLQDISSDTDKLVKNQSALNDSLLSNGNKIDQTNALLGDIKSNQNKDVTLSGQAPSLPSIVYESSYLDPDEESFVSTLQDYMTDGLPLISFINDSYVDISGADPVLSAVIYNNAVEVDLSDFESIFNMLGVILLGVATLIAFQIIIGH